MTESDPRPGRARRAGVAGLLGALLLTGAAGCGSSDAGSVDIAASKAVAAQKGISPGGSPASKSAGPKRGQAPRAAPARFQGR